MSKYIGVKIVDAEPMARGDAEKALSRTISTVGSDTPDDGYMVTYESGYKSWCPKDTFEKSNRPYDTPADRLAVEHDDLQDKISKLYCFMGTRDYLELSPANRILIDAQAEVMKSYRDTLEVRLELVNKPKGEQ